MSIDDKISFVSGAAVSTATTANTIQELDPNAIAYMAVYGLVGGFFGLVGKQLFYWLKDKL